MGNKLSSQGCAYWCSNERNWLIALNVFIMISGAILSAAAIALTITTNIRYQASSDGADDGDKTIYETWIALAAMGCFQVMVAIMGIIAADRVSLHLMVVTFWLTVLIMIVIFVFMVTALDFQYSFQVWINQHWVDNSLRSWRMKWCERDTYDTLCKVPVAGYPYQDQTEWCVQNYNSTRCPEIREEALNTAFSYVEIWMNAAGVIALSSVLEMLSSLYLYVRVVTVPIIMLSMQSTCNYIMIFPSVATITMGFFVGKYDAQYNQMSSVDIAYYITGAFLMAMILVGVAAASIKHRRLLQFYIGGLWLSLIMYIMLASMSFYLVATLRSDSKDQTQQEVWNTACHLGLYNCCCCITSNSTYYTAPACPEYSADEVVDISLALIKIGAIMTLPAMFFVCCSLVASAMLHKNLKGYQCDYI